MSNDIFDKLAFRTYVVMAAREMYANLPEGTNFAIAIGGASGAISQKAVYANSFEDAEKSIFKPIYTYWVICGPGAFVDKPQIVTSWDDAN